MRALFSRLLLTSLKDSEEYFDAQSSVSDGEREPKTEEGKVLQSFNISSPFSQCYF